VREGFERGDGFVDHVMAALAGHAGNEAYAASIVLLVGVVER